MSHGAGAAGLDRVQVLEGELGRALAGLGRAVEALRDARVWLGYIDAPESRALADAVIGDPTCEEAAADRAEYVALYHAVKALVRYWDEDVANGDIEGDIAEALAAIDARRARTRPHESGLGFDPARRIDK